VRRPALIALFALLLAGCGGEKTVSPTGPVEGELPKAEKGDPAAGKKVFLDNDCGGCHALKAAGTNGTTGPDLDESLKGKDVQYIRTSIVDPSAEVKQGYPDVMPKDYGSKLSAQELADLVAFLQQGS